MNISKEEYSYSQNATNMLSSIFERQRELKQNN